MRIQTDAGLSPADIEEAKAILYNKGTDRTPPRAHEMLTPALRASVRSDWHYVKQNPGKIAYALPLFFSDDWMNLHWDSRYLVPAPIDFHTAASAGMFAPEVPTAAVQDGH
jgi:hypothetical protein